MPRLEYNNPVERIRRLLQEMEELSTAFDELVELATDYGLVNIPHKPALYAMVLEQERQRRTYKKVKDTRMVMQRSRMRQEAKDEDQLPTEPPTPPKWSLD